MGKSVSRVGGKAQLPAYRSVTGNLKLAYSQFEELETFSRFGTRMDEDTRKIVEHGKRIRFCFKQQELQPMSVSEQIMVLIALTGKLFDTIPIEKMQEAELALLEMSNELPADLAKRLLSDKKLSDQDRKTILEIAEQILSPFQINPTTDEGAN